PAPSRRSSSSARSCRCCCGGASATRMARSIEMPPVTRRALPTRWAFPAFALFMLVLPLLPVPDFWITQSNYIGLYSLVALGLVLLTGVGGLTSFGQAAFV